MNMMVGIGFPVKMFQGGMLLIHFDPKCWLLCSVRTISCVGRTSLRGIFTCTPVNYRISYLSLKNLKTLLFPCKTWMTCNPENRRNMRCTPGKDYILQGRERCYIIMPSVLPEFFCVFPNIYYSISLKSTSYLYYPASRG
jgi:hypothetical protein